METQIVKIQELSKNATRFYEEVGELNGQPLFVQSRHKASEGSHEFTEELDEYGIEENQSYFHSENFSGYYTVDKLISWIEKHSIEVVIYE